MVSQLTKAWPLSTLNLNQLEVPIDCLSGYFTRPWGEGELSLADMVRRGLLMMQTGSRLQSVILPDSESEGREHASHTHQ